MGLTAGGISIIMGATYFMVAICGLTTSCLQLSYRTVVLSPAPHTAAYSECCLDPPDNFECIKEGSRGYIGEEERSGLRLSFLPSEIKNSW